MAETDPTQVIEEEQPNDGVLTFDVAVRGGVILTEEVIDAAVETATAAVITHMLIPREEDAIVEWAELVRVALNAGLPSIVAALSEASTDPA